MQMEIDMRLFPFDTQRLNIVLGWDLSGGHPASKKPGFWWVFNGHTVDGSEIWRAPVDIR